MTAGGVSLRRAPRSGRLPLRTLSRRVTVLGRLPVASIQAWVRPEKRHHSSIAKAKLQQENEAEAQAGVRTREKA